MYGILERLRCTPETNITSYVNYSVKEKILQRLGFETLPENCVVFSLTIESPSSEDSAVYSHRSA